MKKNLINKIFSSSIAALGAGLIIIAGNIAPAFAHEVAVGSSSLGTQLRTQTTTRLVDRANQEITRRLKTLNQLITRIGEMQKISTSQKATLTASLQSQITALTSLQTKIQNDASANATSSLKDDVKSITASYRIYALVIPQASIMAAADRIITIANTMQTLGGKIQTRIAAAQASGTDVSAAQTALTDFNAKVADAIAQAQAAINEVAPLTPDNGDQTKFQANHDTLMDARKKLTTAHQDLAAARHDAATIVSTIKGFKGLNNTHASGTKETSTSTSSE